MLRVISLAAKAGVREQSEMEGLISYLKGKGYAAVVRSTVSYTHLTLPTNREV